MKKSPKARYATVGAVIRRREAAAAALAAGASRQSILIEVAQLRTNANAKTLDCNRADCGKGSVACRI